MNGPRRAIRRYSNRKLYDMKDSRYVTLQEIGDMVRAGEGVQIVDHKTGEDKTDIALAQILSEDLRAEPHSVPLAVLRGLIETRGGRFWSQLRDGPLGRLLPRIQAPENADAPAMAAALGEAPGDGAISGWDPPDGTPGNNAAAMVPSAEAFQALQTAVADLTKRVASIEATLHVRRDTAGAALSPNSDPRDRPLVPISAR